MLFSQDVKVEKIIQSRGKDDLKPINIALFPSSLFLFFFFFSNQKMKCDFSFSFLSLETSRHLLVICMFAVICEFCIYLHSSVYANNISLPLGKIY